MPHPTDLDSLPKYTRKTFSAFGEPSNRHEDGPFDRLFRDHGRGHLPASFVTASDDGTPRYVVLSADRYRELVAKATPK